MMHDEGLWGILSLLSVVEPRAKTTLKMLTLHIGGGVAAGKVGSFCVCGEGRYCQKHWVRPV